ncbi:MAG: aminodeoxychorismate synthase component I [Betaproteobacteria bacterium]
MNSSNRSRTKTSSNSSCAASNPPVFALFEDRLAPAGAPAAWLLTGLVEAQAISDLGTLRQALEGADAWTAIALDYELGYLLEPAAAPAARATSTLDRPLARLWRFETCRQLTGVEAEAYIADALSDMTDAAAGIGGLEAGIDIATYEQAVERIQALIEAGDCYQVNFTFPLDFTWFGSPLALYAALRHRQPVRYGGIVVAGGEALVSLSPELFLERQGNRLTTRPMKGTAPKAEAASALLGSEKNRAENLMIVDLLRNDLGRVADIGSVTVESLFEIEEYPTVRQMVSQVAANVSNACLFDILGAMFPCGSVTGAPKIRAMQIAAGLEKEARGIYTGALGWIAPHGDFRLNVAIRTLELAADGRGRLGIGSGIVADSDAAEEWRECGLKAAFLTELDPGFSLIETLRREAGVYPRLSGHLERLAASAAWLGFGYDESTVRQALATAPAIGTWRVRLMLDKRGEVEISTAALPPEPDGAHQACLANDRLDSRHVLRRHKTTVRGQYDRALAELASRPEVFDVIFLNERGEVAEGARSNVFVERDGILLTPPVDSGALPGVLRAELLASGKAREAVLHAADLVGEIWLGNALRGLVPVTLGR